MVAMSVREFNANISRVFARVDAGEDVVLTRNGRRWIRMTRDEGRDNAEARERDIAELMALIDAGIDLGGPATYDERTGR